MRGASRIVCGLMLAGSTVISEPAVAQAVLPPAGDVAALRQDMQAVRKSVDDLAAVVKQFLAESGRRERANLLLRRIEVAEQQAAGLSTELRELRADLGASERRLQQSRDRLQSARSMAGFDRGGAAAPLLQQEQDRAMADEATAQNDTVALQQRIADLENELGAKRAQIRNLEALLEKELPSLPR